MPPARSSPRSDPARGISVSWRSIHCARPTSTSRPPTSSSKGSTWWPTVHRSSTKPRSTGPARGRRHRRQRLRSLPVPRAQASDDRSRQLVRRRARAVDQGRARLHCRGQAAARRRRAPHARPAHPAGQVHGDQSGDGDAARPRRRSEIPARLCRGDEALGLHRARSRGIGSRVRRWRPPRRPRNEAPVRRRRSARRENAVVDRRRAAPRSHSPRKRPAEMSPP
jgi:hypothetical protein